MMDNIYLKKEVEFENNLRALLAEYNYSLSDVIEIIEPLANIVGGASGETQSVTRSRRKRVGRGKEKNYCASVKCNYN
jgi:hypothetical protein